MFRQIEVILFTYYFKKIKTRNWTRAESFFHLFRLEILDIILPCTVASVQISDNRHENDFLLKSLPFHYPQWDVLHQRMYANNNVWFILH